MLGLGAPYAVHEAWGPHFGIVGLSDCEAVWILSDQDGSVSRGRMPVRRAPEPTRGPALGAREGELQSGTPGSAIRDKIGLQRKLTPVAAHASPPYNSLHGGRLQAD